MLPYSPKLPSERGEEKDEGCNVASSSSPSEHMDEFLVSYRKQTPAFASRLVLLVD